MNQQELDKLKTLCEAARPMETTEGSWTNVFALEDLGEAARTAIPQLIARIEKLEAVVEAAAKLLTFTDHNWTGHHAELDKALTALEEKE